MLIAEVPVEHDYAHCERCHNPVVFRTTKQWFFKVEDLKDKMLKANSGVLWVPDAGKNAFDSWLTHLRDNSITKQRFWGTPVPIWRCGKCREYIVVESADELRKLKAKNIPESLHKPWIDEVVVPCKCGNEMRRIPDILDVWIDAGSASWNCLYYPSRKDLFDKYFPADFILEAKEQVRGWFNLLMIASMIAFDKPCFKAVYMHGMLTDIEGQKMSKSLGNVISPYELVDKHGADTLRAYLCSTPAGEDISFSWEEASQRYRAFSVLWNVQNYLVEYAKTASINPANLKVSRLGVEERYILSRLNRIMQEVTELYEAYNLDEVPRKLENLFLELSRVYIQLTRDKINEKPETVLYAIYHVLLETMKMLSIVAPFVSEKIYLNLKGAFGLKEESITHYEWPSFDSKMIDEKLEKQMELAQNVMQAVLSCREKAQIGVRWPLPAAYVSTEDRELKEAVEALKGIILNQVNVKDVIIARKDGEFEAECRGGKVVIDTALTPELEAEGFAREVSRRVQELRKKNKLKKADSIELSIVSDVDLKKWEKEIASRVGASRVFFSDKGFAVKSEEKVKGKSFVIGLRKI